MHMGDQQMRQRVDRLSFLMPYRVSLIRSGEQGLSSDVARRRSRLLRLAPPLAAVTAVCALGLASVMPVSASSSGGTTATVNIAVRSITVSPSTSTFDYCADNTYKSTGGYLSFPNGICAVTSGVTITNGTASGNIDVQGADAIPSDNGTHWTLCGGTGPSCTGGAGNAGQDQFRELESNNSNNSPLLTTSPQCDTAFNAGSCAATSGQAATQALNLYGPSASTDTSSSFSTVWTWTAVP